MSGVIVGTDLAVPTPLILPKPQPFAARSGLTAFSTDDSDPLVSFVVRALRQAQGERRMINAY